MSSIAPGSVSNRSLCCIFTAIWSVPHLERLLNRETLEDPHKAQLICEAQALRIPATLGDLRQLASPQVNRRSKSDKDAAEWMPELNECWFASRIVQVRRKYGLTIDRREADTLEGVLSACKSTEIIVQSCGQ